MRISILTLFPDMFQGPFDASIIKRAKEKNLVDIEYINIRDFGIGKHKIVDDTPYGGGIGMVMRVDVLHEAIERTKNSFLQQFKNKTIKQYVILLSASGKQYKQSIAKEFSKIDHLIIVCGHYEGIDERISQYIDEEISIGDFVVTGGELPAMLIADSVIRLLPGVITEGAAENESFSLTENGYSLLEYPHYTKPASYNGTAVPDVLLSGNHAEIDKWRKEKSVEKTNKIRPELMKE